MKLKTLLWCFVCTVFTTLQAQDLLITELTDPQNSSDAGRYVNSTIRLRMISTYPLGMHYNVGPMEIQILNQLLL